MPDDVFDRKSLSGTVGVAPIGTEAHVPEPGHGLKTRAVVEPADERHSPWAPLKITRDLTIASVDAQYATLAGSLAHGCDVTLDLSGVRACDTAGLQLIYSFGKSIRHRGGHLQIVAVSPEVQEIAAAVGLQLKDWSDVPATVAADTDSPARSTGGGL